MHFTSNWKPKLIICFNIVKIFSFNLINVYYVYYLLKYLPSLLVYLLNIYFKIFFLLPYLGDPSFTITVIYVIQLWFLFCCGWTHFCTCIGDNYRRIDKAIFQTLLLTKKFHFKIIYCSCWRMKVKKILKLTTVIWVLLVSIISTIFLSRCVGDEKWINTFFFCGRLNCPSTKLF